MMDTIMWILIALNAHNYANRAYQIVLKIAQNALLIHSLIQWTLLNANVC